MAQIKIQTPDDWHLHLRESPILEKVFPYSYKSYGRAIIMPNLEIPIITFSQAKSYYEKIKYLIKACEQDRRIVFIFPPTYNVTTILQNKFFIHIH